jgi:hypothetical protein
MKPRTFVTRCIPEASNTGQFLMEGYAVIRELRKPQTFFRLNAMAEEIDPVQEQNTWQDQAQNQAHFGRHEPQSGTRQAKDEDGEGIHDKQDCKDAKERPQRIQVEGFVQPAMNDMPEAARHSAGQAGNSGNGMEGAMVEVCETGRHEPGRGQSHEPDCAPYHFMVHTRFR